MASCHVENATPLKLLGLKLGQENLRETVITIDTLLAHVGTSDWSRQPDLLFDRLARHANLET